MSFIYFEVSYSRTIAEPAATAIYASPAVLARPLAAAPGLATTVGDASTASAPFSFIALVRNVSKNKEDFMKSCVDNGNLKKKRDPQIVIGF